MSRSHLIGLAPQRGAAPPRPTAQVAAMSTTDHTGIRPLRSTTAGVKMLKPQM
jgi:hypothetical protein